MSKFLFKNFNYLMKLRARASVTLVFAHTQYLFYSFLQTHPFSSLGQSVENSSKRSSVTVNYFINSCGLTPKRAALVSKRVNFEVTDKPDSVLTFFKDKGFTQTQISKVVNCSPQLILSSPEKTLLPKLEFLKSKGFSDSEVAVIISLWPQILMRSLENQLIPSFNFFSNLLLSNERKNFSTFKRSAGVLLFDIEKHGTDNIEMLKKVGMPLRNIEYLLASKTNSFMTNYDNFKHTLDEVTKMGFSPFKISFAIAILVLRSMTKSTWNHKVGVYKKWGWSEDDVIAAFRKNPWCMIKSEDKITSVMNLWVNKMGLETSLLANRPDVLIYSLEKRIAPRCEVYQFLVSNGLLNPADNAFAPMISISENRFIEKYIEPHKEVAPNLLKLYKQKLEAAK